MVTGDRDFCLEEPEKAPRGCRPPVVSTNPLLGSSADVYSTTAWAPNLEMPSI